MSYPGPPGVPSAHPSLPPRPPAGPGSKQQQQPIGPQATSRFSSTFSSHSTYSAPPGYPASTAAGAAAPPPPPSYSSAAPGYSAPPSRYGAPSTTSYSSYSATPTAMPVRNSGGYGRGGYGGGGGGTGAGATTYSSGYNNYRQPNAQPSAASYGAGPQIRNPFPVPGAAGAAAPAAGPVSAQSEEAEMAAQMAQWQSAYLPRSETDPVVAGPIGPDATSQYPQQAQQPEQAEAGANGDERKKTVYRTGGGKKWADDTLVEWDPTHLRLFVGNLAGETTDESLLKAFSRWKSVQKSKVIRDKRTNKSKGYGFVSFSDPDDFFQAAKEMNGKYIQSHPVTCRKANTDIKVTNVKPDKRHGGRNDKRKGNGGGGGGGGGYEPRLGPHNPGGIVKPGQKTKGGLKLLG
ncbi:hypothetical protein PspLS_04483 [Pyricularia sp. CBS 133598]|nr:hypothetical protein PspLS_04483 [Pyricularia sp. CBS 133598]